MDRRGFLAAFAAFAAAPAAAQGQAPSPFAPLVEYAIEGQFGRPADGKPPEAARIWRTREAIRYAARDGIERVVV
ncbi:MAG: hypothetical protein JNL71_18330, partial [Rhodospirillales bacterium]|nr:hypothetical protein [Rhodospirillales bacterium]